MDRLAVTSSDGTTITAHVVGSGPPVVLLHGGTADHTRWAPLLPWLAEDFTLCAVDRRGRGGSVDEADEYSLDREGDDLLAVLSALDEPALVFGHSYGALVTLNALDRLTDVLAVLLYEPPFATAAHRVFGDEQIARWDALLRDGRREALLEAFYREALQFDDDALAAARALPAWPARIAAVHTITREARAVRAFSPRRVRPDVPVRLLVGDATTAYLAASTRAAADLIENSELCVLPGHGHVAIDAEPQLIARHVRETWDLGRASQR